MSYEEFETKLPCPNRNDYTTVYNYFEGKIIFSGSLAQWNASPSQKVGVVEKVIDHDAYKDQQNLYYADRDRLEQKFKEMLEEQYGTTNNPKKDKLYSIAWAKGHASGLSDVACQYDDLVGLIKE